MSANTPKENAILEAATELFLDKGFKDVSITNIVQKAGCSRETVYRYFENKEEIFASIISNLMETYLTAMELAISLQTEDLREGLIDWSLSLLESTTDEKYIQFRRLVISEVNTRPEHGKLYFDMTYKKGTKAVADYFRLFQKRGRLKKIESNRLAAYFVGMILYEIVHTRVFAVRKKPSKSEIKKLVERTVDDFLEGYAV
jgi:AcrR family transcriptional regulator